MPFLPAIPEHEAGLAALFSALAAAGDERLFHPHPLTPEAARAICRRRDTAGPNSADEFHVAIPDSDSDGPGAIVAYGLLRGWAEGFAVPSLGIAVHPDHRGRGIARRLMHHLHDVAAGRGAERVRLKVYRHNAAALRLYESLGYEFRPHSPTELVGTVVLGQPITA
jgi:[ribosomal protein S18]-alanine N-acetyltransferase